MQPLYFVLFCRPDCYKHITGKRKRNEDEWNKVEKAILAKCKDIFHKSNYCSMSAIVKTKTCKQVYEFLSDQQNENGDGEENLKKSKDDKSKSKKRKKRTYNLGLGRTQHRRSHFLRRGLSLSF